MREQDREEAINMDDEICRATRRCSDCDCVAPTVATDFTLISARHSWRLTRTIENGTMTLHWRCAPCWAKHKEAKQALKVG
jgi:hypothetical protein